jgi:dienelactone hydrolase
MLNRIFAGILLSALAACANISPQVRRQHADTLAATQQWQKLSLPTDEFVLTAYVPPALIHSDMLTIYIEGDGFAWVTSSQPSDDPTPRDPIGLRLAMRHAPGAAVYLARPCQYVEGADARGCMTSFWTERRFAPEVIAATDHAIDALKVRYNARRLMLVGYSGGGAVAALVAARRKDVAQLVTVAGNLDHAAWTRLNHVRPLDGSLNPADAWRDLLHIPQVHFVGARDNNVGAAVANAYADRFPANARPRIQMVPEADHSCCWVDRWPALLATQPIIKD